MPANRALPGSAQSGHSAIRAILTLLNRSMSFIQASSFGSLESTPSPIRDIKMLEEKHRWLQRRRSLIRLQNSNDQDPERGEGKERTPPLSQKIVSKSQFQPPRSPATVKRQRIKLPARNQDCSRLLSDKEIGKERIESVIQDLEGGGSGGDLVQVRIAHISDRESWTGVHQSRRLLGKERMLKEQYSRSWAGVPGQ